jgi:glycosyltransferase involved in cell wall biosynthesis
VKPLRVLFYKRDLQWPFRSGHDVHTTNMMKALAAAGHHIGLVTAQPVPAGVRESLQLELQHTLDAADGGSDRNYGLPGLQERFRRFWGINSTHLETLQRLSDSFKADAVVVSGMDVLPVLAAIRGPLRIWYAADELALHHFSQLRLTEPSTWRELPDGMFKGFYERVFQNAVDRVWAVSDVDVWAFKRLAGMHAADLIPNGVDAERYQPSSTAEQPFTAAFWGRLDFGPNIQGLQWFCSRVWPLVRERHPQAQFTIIGFHPGDAVQHLATLPGVRLCADVPDVQALVHSHAIAVLPFTSGTGIKNKLLEAAAMGKAIVCTPTALSGLSNPPFAGLQKPRAWVDDLSMLWQDEPERRRRGVVAREWVTAHHSWASAAQKAEAAIAEGLERRS